MVSERENLSVEASYNSDRLLNLDPLSRRSLPKPRSSVPDPEMGVDQELAQVYSMIVVIQKLIDVSHDFNPVDVAIFFRRFRS